MSDWIDISVPLEGGRTYWPDDPPFHRHLLAAGEARVSAISMSVHAGTHVDAPLHYLADGAAVDAIPLQATVGTARVSERVEATAERMLLRIGRELTEDEARLLTGCLCVGIDGPSVGDRDVHRILLGSGVWIVEWLDLRLVEPGDYDFVCLPLKIAGADGAPARAILRRRG